MIYTVTLNPSLDYFVTVDSLEPGKTNRTGMERMLPGGKGINVSIVLKNLGIENTALGFAAGFTGREIIRLLEKEGIRPELIMLPEGYSRINVKVQNMEGTEINGIGPDISAIAMEVLRARIAELADGDSLVLAGSIPKGVSKDIYRELIQLTAYKKVSVVVDATGEVLRQILPCRPFLIKPNHHELGELFGVELTERAEVIPYARKLQEEGARNVLISMAGKGAVLVTEEGQTLEMDAPKGKYVNGVGAGDSMVAGFLAGWQQQKNYRHAFRLAVCAGSASAFSENLAGKREIEALFCEQNFSELCCLI